MRTRLTFAIVIGVLMVLTLRDAHSDSRLASSSVQVSACNSNVSVVHEHTIKPADRAEHEYDAAGIAFEIFSVLRFRSKNTQDEEFEIKIGPLTSLTAIEGSPYFAGLSNLKTHSYEYNFVLFSESGEILAKALITEDSGHCASVSSSLTNRISWFDTEHPEVTLEYDEGTDETLRAFVVNPYDRTGDGVPGLCTIEL